MPKRKRKSTRRLREAAEAAEQLDEQLLHKRGMPPFMEFPDDEDEIKETDEAAMQRLNHLQGSLGQAMSNPLQMLEEVKGPLMEAGQKFMDKATECLKNDRANIGEAVFGMLQNLVTLVTDFMNIMSKQQAKLGHGPGPAQQLHQQQRALQLPDTGEERKSKAERKKSRRNK